MTVFFPFVYHACGPISRARFSQSHQGFDTCRHHQSEIINYYKTFPTIQESTYSYLSVEMKKWKKNYENIPFEERPATAGNSAFSLFRHFQPFTRSVLFFLLNPWEVFLRTLFSCFETSQIVEPSTMNEERLSGLGMLLIHRRTNYRPESEVIYKIYQDWGK